MALSLVLPLVAGCALLASDQEMRIAFPPLPAAWKALAPETEAVLEVVFSDGSGWTQEADYADGSATVVLPKGGGAAILLTPRCRGLKLPPAGTAVPWLAAQGSAEATWSDGVTATVLQRLALGGAGFEALNVGRLSGEIKDRAGPDPWKIDIDRIVEKLAAGAFRSTYIREEETTPVTLMLPPGDWISVSPFASQPMVVTPDAPEVTLGVPKRGIHYLNPAGGQLLSLSLDPSGYPTAAFRRF